MRFRVRYGKLHDVENPPLALRLERVVDDALGFRDEDTYWAHLTIHYAGTWAVESDDPVSGEPTREAILRAMETLSRDLDADPDAARRAGEYMSARIRAFWLPTSEDERAPDRLRATFTAAVAQGADGVLSADLAEFLGRLRRYPGGDIEVDDGPALAALALQELLRKGPISCTPCNLCGLLWLPTRGATFCKRPAPGHQWSCQSVALHARFREANEAFHRERRRLYERTRRAKQSITKEQYSAWLAENRPGVEGEDWKRFEDWQAAKEEK